MSFGQRYISRRLLIFGLYTLITAIVYSSCCSYLSVGDTKPNEILPLSVLHDGNLNFNEFKPTPNTTNYWFQEVSGNRLSNYSILAGLLNVPVFALAEKMGVPVSERVRGLSSITAIALVALTIGFSYLITIRASEDELTAFLVTAAFAFGSTYFSLLTRSLWEHNAAVLFLTIALFLIRTPGWVASAGLFLGLAVASRYADIAIALPLALYVWRYENRYFIRFSLLAALPASFLLLYYLQEFGSPLAILTSAPRNIGYFRSPSVDSLAGLLFSPNRGLFVFSPFLLFGLYGIYISIRQNVRDYIFNRFLLAALLSFYFLIASWKDWWGGQTFGYRLLTDILPILLIFCVYSLQSLRHAVWRLSFAGLLMGSIFINFLGARLYPCGFNTKVAMGQEPEKFWLIENGEIARCMHKLRSKNLFEEEEVP